jgi:hypothetical protein
LLSTPPDKPRTMPVVLVFSTYSFMKRVTLFSTSDKFNSRIVGFRFTFGHLSAGFYWGRQVFKDKRG